MQSTGNSIQGKITFVDSSFYTQGGTYAVALYAYKPPASFSYEPVAVQNISPSKSVNYTISYDGGGYYYIAVVWINNSNISELPMVLGVHGCDTTHNCDNEISIAFPNYTGHSFDIVSWADTTKKLY